MTIKHDKPFEVNKNQYDYIMQHYKQLVAGRFEDGKYYLKCWAMEYANDIARDLEVHK